MTFSVNILVECLWISKCNPLCVRSVLCWGARSKGILVSRHFNVVGVFICLCSKRGAVWRCTYTAYEHFNPSFNEDL